MHDFWALTVSVLNQLLNPIIKGILLCPDVSSYPCSLSKCWGPQKSPTRSNLQAKTTENHQNWCIDTHLSWAAPRISQWNWPSVAWAWPCTAYWLPSLPCLTSTSLPVCPGITFQINYMFWHPCLGVCFCGSQSMITHTHHLPSCQIPNPHGLPLSAVNLVLYFVEVEAIRRQKYQQPFTEETLKANECMKTQLHWRSGEYRWKPLTSCHKYHVREGM